MQTGTLTDDARSALDHAIDARGWARLPSLLSSEQCDALIELYHRDEPFRSTVVMARHGFGSGEYRYFTNPLPPLVQELRSSLYPELARKVNAWQKQLNLDERFPSDLDTYLKMCHEAGQHKPTPLMLRYGPGDYNCLHRDIYGEAFFPLQVVILLSSPQSDFEGGEFVLTEQRPRMQSRVEVVDFGKGDAVIFCGNTRPRQGSRGIYRVASRHGVSTVRSGERFALGLIFHDGS